MLLKGKNIVITGAGRGIGREVAKACAKEGANVGLTSRTLEELNQTKREIEELNLGVKVIVRTADISKYNEVDKIFKEFSEELGLINGIIANAGWSRMIVTHECEPEMFSEIMDINVLGVFNTFKAAYPLLKKDDKKDKARFVITGSATYPSATPKFAAYVASKWAVVGFQKSVVIEYKRENISFNMILPSMTDTRLLRGPKAGDGNKAPGVMDPSDMNDYYLFLFSEEANRFNNNLIYSDDVSYVKKIMNEAPAEKKENWNSIKEYLEIKAPKTLANVKKLGKLIEFLVK
jgi:3-oxoacyl-[acyl-carrier protein] reductase